MGQISPDYASPGLRLGLLLEDHPKATYTFEMKTGSEVGVPDKYGGDKSVCVCTIRFDDGRTDVVAWKPVPEKGQADDWNTLCTKTLGRALKRAGYPDDLLDLKALVLWRNRMAEIDAMRGGFAPPRLTSGQPQAALGSGDTEIDQALDAAGVAAPEGRPGGDEAIVVDADEVPDAEDVQRVLGLLEDLEGEEMDSFLSYLATIGAPIDPRAMTPSQLAEAEEWLEPRD